MIQLGLGFHGQSRNPALITCLQSPTADQRAAAQVILVEETSTRSIEFATLLDNNGTIVVNAGSRNRTGQQLPAYPAGEHLSLARNLERSRARQ